MSICPNFYYFQKLKRFFCYSFLYIYILFYICSIDNTILCQSLTIWYVSLSQSYPTVSHPSLNSSPSKSLSLDTSLICPHILTPITTAVECTIHVMSPSLWSIDHGTPTHASTSIIITAPKPTFLGLSNSFNLGGVNNVYFASSHPTHHLVVVTQYSIV